MFYKNSGRNVLLLVLTFAVAISAKPAAPKALKQGFFTDETTAKEIGYAWIDGFTPDVYWRNTTACFEAYTNFTFDQLVETQKDLGSNYIGLYDKIQSVTNLISNGSNSARFCNSMLNSSASYWNKTYASYREEKNPITTLFMSFTQNLLSGIYSISNIVISMSDNIQAGSMIDVQYDIARLLRVVLIFPKIESISTLSTPNVNAAARLRQNQ